MTRRQRRRQHAQRRAEAKRLRFTRPAVIAAPRWRFKLDSAEPVAGVPGAASIGGALEEMPYGEWYDWFEKGNACVLDLPGHAYGSP